MIKQKAFTMTEVLITLGVVGVVSAITLPILITNINERVLNKQVEIFKHKLADSTSKMNSLGLMTSYESTDDFLNEFSKHYKIVKRCANNELEKCWPGKVVKVPNTSGELAENSVSSIKTGNDLRAFALGTKETETSGIISADGIPIILVYSPRCQMNEVIRGITTASCISAIYDVNGGKGPNRLGVDIRTLNSLYGAINLGTSYTDIQRTGNQCLAVRKQLGVEHVPCPHDVNNAFLGAMKACHDLKLHSPSRETLATAAGATFGITDLGITENINCANNHCWNQPAGRTSSKDNTSVAFSGSFWTDTPFIFRYTSDKTSVTMSCNAGCTNAWRQSALCVGD